MWWWSLCCVFQVQGSDWRLLPAARHWPAAFWRPNWDWRTGMHVLLSRYLCLFIIITWLGWLNELAVSFRSALRNQCHWIFCRKRIFKWHFYLFLVLCCFSSCSHSGHQPEWRSETENLCGQSSLPKHQHRLLGEFNFTFEGRNLQCLYYGHISDFYHPLIAIILPQFCCV